MGRVHPLQLFITRRPHSALLTRREITRALEVPQNRSQPLRPLRVMRRDGVLKHPRIREDSDFHRFSTKLSVPPARVSVRPAPAWRAVAGTLRVPSTSGSDKYPHGRLVGRPHAAVRIITNLLADRHRLPPASVVFRRFT